MEQLPVIALVGLGVVGLLVGSFLNVVIVRMPADESIVSPPSRCPACETEIKPYDNIPIISWFLLRGRCRACGVEYGFAYVLVEAANAVLWVAAGLRWESWALIPMLVLFSTLLAQSVIDLETYRLLNAITFPVLAVSVVLVAVISTVEGDPSRILMAIGGGLGYALALFLVGLIKIGGKQGMGLGDVKLALLLGLFLGWLQPVLIVYSLIIACVLGIVVGAALFVVRRKSEHYPFGPWLAAGCILALLFAEPILEPSGYTIPSWL